MVDNAMIDDYAIVDPSVLRENEIPFTQFLRPDGRRRPMRIVRPLDIVQQARAIVAKGCEFHIEELATLKISMTCFDTAIEEDIAIEVCANGPPVCGAVDRLVSVANDVLSNR